MTIKSAFVLAAGLGTRMGEIGKTLPKVLWPFFDTTLLGLQFKFLEQNAIENIAVNIHHHADKIREYLKANYPKVEILHETELLDSGGGVHNYLKHVQYRGDHCILNSDQLMFLSKNTWSEMQDLLQVNDNVLLTMDNPGGYGSIISDGAKAIAVGKAHEGPMFVGLSMLQAERIKPCYGRSRFFETIVRFENNSIGVVKDKFDFYDFGTITNYASNCFDLFRRLHTDNKLMEKWSGIGILDKTKLSTYSYDTDQKGVLNFSGKALSHPWPTGSIIISEPKLASASSGPVVVYDQICVSVD